MVCSFIYLFFPTLLLLYLFISFLLFLTQFFSSQMFMTVINHHFFNRHIGCHYRKSDGCFTASLFGL